MNLIKKHKMYYIYFLTLMLSIVLYFCYDKDFINSMNITMIYLPIWVVSILPMFFDKILFGLIVIISSIVGLIAEHTLYLSIIHYISIDGSTLHILILLTGFSLGFITQVAYNRMIAG